MSWITGLDLASQATILRVIAEESAMRSHRSSLTHHLDEARRADRVIPLAGQVVADGPLRRLYVPSYWLKPCWQGAASGRVHRGHGRSRPW